MAELNLTGSPRDDGTVPYLPTVVATVDPDTGQRAYVYGWAAAVVQEMNRDDLGPDPRDADMMCPRRIVGAPQYLTHVEWAGGYRITTVYPTADDWARERALVRAARPYLVLADWPELAGPA